MLTLQKKQCSLKPANNIKSCTSFKCICLSKKMLLNESRNNKLRVDECCNKIFFNLEMYLIHVYQSSLKRISKEA